MTFELTDRQHALQSAARELAEGPVQDRAAEVDRTESYPWDHVDRLVEGGFVGMTIPEAYGGQGRSWLDAVLVIEEMSKACSVTGRIVVDGEAFDVGGLSWMDHEFGTSFLEPAQVGWDWFSLQFDDGSDLMVYTMRRDDGAPDPRSSGTFVAPDGSVTRLAAGDYALVPGRRWTSPSSGASYPVAWAIDVPALGIDLDVEATIDAQELQTGESTGVTYWEGAIDARGTREGASVAGQGYLEMTGYAGPPMSRVLR